MDNLNNVLEMFFYQFCGMAKWVFAIRIASDVIKKGNDGDIEGTIKSVISGGLGYGSLYAIVNVLNSVQSSFKK
jgi:hypothetical protein